MVNMFAPKALCSAAERVAVIFADRIAKRNISISADGYAVLFNIVPGMNEESFEISGRENGIIITSGGRLGLIHGAGFFLRGTEFLIEGANPCQWRGTQKPKCTIRGVYFASHFHNFYHVAPSDEIERYIEDLALWGFNYIKAIFPMIDLESEDNPECKENIARLNHIFTLVHDLGMKTATGLTINSGFRDFPREFLFTPHLDSTGRRGNSGNMMCPSIPEANKLIMHYNESFLEQLRPGGLDLVMTWPYDEGGCACEKCYPWGANGFIKGSKQVFELARSIFPDIIRCVSTWCFDTPFEGEWKALSESHQKETWCDCILADAHEDFPRYPLENGIPGGLPLINFPEISMWGLYPWGGWGATALPERFTSLWAQAGHILSGGFLYSEGIYEDVNKAVISQLYWNGGANWHETLGQYARYELGIGDAGEFIKLISLIEQTHGDVMVKGRCDTMLSDQAFALACRINGTLPPWAANSWRWRIIYLRTLLDARRYRIAEEAGTDEKWTRLDWKALLHDDAPVQEAFREIIDLFHCMKEYNGDMYHCRVRPVCD